MKEFYQHLYDDTDYNWQGTKNSPGIRYFPLYRDWLKGTIFDWGCGNGSTVRFLRKEGYIVDGMDWIDLKNGIQVGDITNEHNIYCDTALCIDVLEHIIDYQGVFKNLLNGNRQIINISNTPSPVENVELHINKKPFDEWEKILNKYFKIVKIIEPRVGNMLYLCEE